LKGRLLFIICFLSFAGIALFLTFNRHSKSGYFNYHSEIWADKAGYYVYLPATFNFKFNPSNFPDSVDIKTGNGFFLDKENGKVITKYTYGVALLQTPFYAVAELLAKPLNYEPNGFSPIYHWSINVASVFYLLLGLLFLKKYLKIRFDNRSSIFTVLSIFLATHLYYYSIDETGMSHVYSFSLFCLFLYIIEITNHLAKFNFWMSFVFGLLIGLILLIRPTNILFLSTFIFLDNKNWLGLRQRLQKLFSYKFLIPIVFGISIVALPQLLYWNYTSDSIVSYSYGNEEFNWVEPKMVNVWFSPNNGLFLYTPFYLLIIAIILIMIKYKQNNGVYLLSLFLVISYVFSSWWSWS
jgi:hypothetical protein